MQTMLMSDGGGGGEYFSLHRSLQGEINKSISNVEEIFHQVFRQIAYFQKQLNPQRGMAAATLKETLNIHVEVINKSANALLNFADIVNSLIVAIETTDDGDFNIVAPRGRMEWQYSLSVERIEEEIALQPKSMWQAAIDFQTNLIHVDEVFSAFTKMLQNVTEASHLPWGNLRGIWTEAISRGESIAEETTAQIEKLTQDTKLFVREMARLDHMAGAAMIQI